jgi:hypothetical protein
VLLYPETSSLLDSTLTTIVEQSVRPVLVYLLTFGPAAFSLRFVRKDLTTLDASLESRLLQLFERNEQIHPFYSKRELLVHLDRYIQYLRDIRDLVLMNC